MTAVEYLIEEMQKRIPTFYAHYVMNMNEVYKQAKEMEKQQMCKIYEGILQNVGTSIKQNDLPTFEQYYNETYGSKGSDENHAYCGIIDCKCTTSSQTEITEKIILKEATDRYVIEDEIEAFMQGANWMQEQLKKKQYENTTH